jgi:hypothetical protein
MKHEVKENRRGELPMLYTLKEAVAAFGTSGITVSSLRREVNAGRIRCARSRPGRNAKILVAHAELMRWLEEEAGVRQFVATEVRNG